LITPRGILFAAAIMLSVFGYAVIQAAPWTDSHAAQGGIKACFSFAVQDSDGDGFRDCTEEYLGTDPFDRCTPPADSGKPLSPSLAWPADLNTNGTSFKKVNLVDLASFIGPIRRLGSSPGNPSFDIRWDLVGGGVPQYINLLDISAMITGQAGFPPMLGGAKAFGGPACTES